MNIMRMKNVFAGKVDKDVELDGQFVCFSENLLNFGMNLFFPGILKDGD